MRTYTLPWTFEEIGKGENKSLKVEFECHASPGSPGSYWEPPEPPEVEFASVALLSLMDGDGWVVVSPSWLETLRGIAFDLAEKNRGSLEETLLEHIGDVEEADMDDYYDRKRDELRGC